MTLTSTLRYLIGMLALSGGVVVCAQSANVSSPELVVIQAQRTLIAQEKKQVLDEF